MDTQINVPQTHVGITTVVSSYAKTSHPKPHKKMIIDKYIPTIEAAQRVAEETLIMHVEKIASVKQYKGKRDPTTNNTRPIPDTFVAETHERQQQVPQTIDLLDSKSSTNHTPGSTKTVCSDNGAIELSTCHSGHSDSDSGLYSPYDTSKLDRHRHLVRSAIEAFERNVPCMSTLDRVMAWRVAPNLDEVEEFSSDATETLKPFRTHLLNYSAVHSDTLPTLTDQQQLYSKSDCMESSILLRVDYTKKPNGNTATHNRIATTEPFKLPYEPIESPIPSGDQAVEIGDAIVIDSSSDEFDRHVKGSPKKHTTKRDSSLLGEVEDGCGNNSGSSESQKEELYKYLGIDTNPIHSRDAAAAANESNTDELEARCKRRSLRVKVQQIAINNLAKYHREKESIERDRRMDDSCQSKVDQESLPSQRKSIMACKNANKPNGLGNSETPKHHRLLMPTATTPKDRRLAAATACTSSSNSATSSSQNSGKFSNPNGAVAHFAHKNPVINLRSRGRPRKPTEPLSNLPKNQSMTDIDVETTTIDSPNRRSDNHKKTVTLPLTKRRHSDQDAVSDLYNIKADSKNHDEPTATHNASASIRSTSSASPYPQTTSSNELARPRSEKNFTSDERASNKSSPLIPNALHPTIQPASKKPSLLERRDYSKSLPQVTPVSTSSTKSPTFSYLSTYSTKVLMANRKLNEAAAVTSPPIVFDPTSPPPPISERLQLRQLQRLAELENSPQEKIKTPRLATKQKTINSKRQVLKVILQRQKSTPTMKKLSRDSTSLQCESNAPETPAKINRNLKVLPEDTNNVSPVADISVTRLPELGAVPLQTAKAAPIRQRRPAVSPRIRRLNHLRIFLRSSRRSASVRREFSASTPTRSTNIGRRLLNRSLRPANIFRRREPVDEDSAGTAAAFSEEDSVNPIKDSPAQRSPSAIGSDFLGFEECDRLSQMSVDTIDELSQTCEPSPLLDTTTAAETCSMHIDTIDEELPESSLNVCHNVIPIDISVEVIDESRVLQIVESTSSSLESVYMDNQSTKSSEPASPILESTPKNILTYVVTSDESPEPPSKSICQKLESTATSAKSSRSSSFIGSNKSMHFPVERAICTPTNTKIINDLVSAAVAEIIGVAPVLCAKTIMSEQTRSPCGPIINSSPLRASSGAVLAVVKAQSSGNVVAVVQEREVSFWLEPSRVFDIFGVKQQWTCQAGIVRRTEDTEVKSPYQNRVLTHNGQLVYIECRAKQFEPTKTRECYLCAVYLNVYFYDQNTGEASMHIVDLDKILGLADSIRYTSISGPNPSVVVSWTERSAQRVRCGFCKYTLSMELDMLEEVNEYPFAEHTVLSLSCFEEDKLLVLGENSVMLWDYRTGDMLLNLDIDQPLGVSLGGFIAEERSNRFMFLIQLVPTQDHAKRLELLSINLSDYFSIKVVQSHDIPVDFADLSTSCVTSGNVITATFTSGHSLLMSLGDPRHIHLRQPHAVLSSPLTSVSNIERAPSRQSFVMHDQIVQVFEDHMSIHTLWDHFHGDCD